MTQLIQYCPRLLRKKPITITINIYTILKPIRLKTEIIAFQVSFHEHRIVIQLRYTFFLSNLNFTTSPLTVCHLVSRRKMLVNSYIVLVLCKIIFVLASDLECQNNCLRKCCPDGQSFYRGKNGTSCSGKSTMQLGQLLDLTPYNIIHGKTCPEGHDKIMIDKFKMDGVTVVWEGRTFNSTNSCVESYNDTLVAIICAVDEDVMEIVAYTGNVN